ncbi:MAG: hypothetical protein AAGJ31_10555, partial [Verrucomicrobiota bacterium]
LAWVPPVSRDVCPYLPPAKRCDEKPRDWLLGPSVMDVPTAARQREVRFTRNGESLKRPSTHFTKES